MTKDEARKFLRKNLDAIFATDDFYRDDFVHAIEALLAEPEWIACSERLPEVEDLCLCHGEGQHGLYMTLNRYCGNNIWRFYPQGDENKSHIDSWTLSPRK